MPVLRLKRDKVLERAEFDPQSHAGRALINVLENYPRDEQQNPLMPKRPTPELIFLPMQSIPDHLVSQMLAHNLGT